MGLSKLSPNVSSDEAKKMAKILIDKLKQAQPPLAAYLFGSGANEGLTDDSDLDLLVVFKSQDEIQKAQTIVFQSGFSNRAVDWVFVLESEFQKRKSYGGVCFEAFNHGWKIL